MKLAIYYNRVRLSVRFDTFRNQHMLYRTDLIQCDRYSEDSGTAEQTRITGNLHALVAR